MQQSEALEGISSLGLPVVLGNIRLASRVWLTVGSESPDWPNAACSLHSCVQAVNHTRPSDLSGAQAHASSHPEAAVSGLALSSTFTALSRPR